MPEQRRLVNSRTEQRARSIERTLESAPKSDSQAAKSAIGCSRPCFSLLPGEEQSNGRTEFQGVRRVSAGHTLSECAKRQQCTSPQRCAAYAFNAFPRLATAWQAAVRACRVEPTCQRLRRFGRPASMWGYFEFRRLVPPDSASLASVGRLQRFAAT